MVVPIRELVNIQTSTSAFNSKPSQMVKIPANVAMNINSDSIRERLNSLSKTSSKSASVTLNVSSIPYYERIEINNDFPDEKVGNPVDSSQLSYKDNDGTGNSVRKTTDIGPTRNQQCVQSKNMALKNTSTT